MKMGAVLVIFSGGKTFCGPQLSGLILDKKETIDIYKIMGAPHHVLTHSSKVGREEMVGIYTALKEYLSLDHNTLEEKLERYI